MMLRLRGFLSLSVLAFATPLAAQEPAAAAPPASACPVDLMQPAELGVAGLQLQKVMNAKNADDANKALRDATKLLFGDKVKSNPAGRDLLLGEFLVLALEFQETSTLGALGIPGDKKAAVDLPTMIDSLFTSIEKANPACESETEQWRQYKWYNAKIQEAYKAVNADQPDSAEKLARRAMVLSRTGAPPYDILWRVAKARGDEAGQVTNLQAAADRLKGDTLNARIRSNLMFNLGRIQQEFAEAKTDSADKAANYKAAAATFNQLAREFPAALETPFAVSGVGISFAMTNDTSMVTEALEAILSQKEAFTDAGLAQGAVLATSLRRTPDAVALFEESAKKNPYQRDYQYNLAAMLYEAKRSRDMIPVVAKLVALDPSNPDNYMLYAFAYNGLAEGPLAQFQKFQRDSIMGWTKAAPAARKTVVDSIVYYRALVKPLQDSMALYSKIADELPQRLTYTDFERGEENTVLRGQVENKSQAEKSYAIEFEFLDRAGTSIGTSTTTVGPVGAGQTANFSVELAKGGVSGVRYTGLPLK